MLESLFLKEMVLWKTVKEWGIPPFHYEVFNLQTWSTQFHDYSNFFQIIGRETSFLKPKEDSVAQSINSNHTVRVRKAMMMVVEVNTDVFKELFTFKDSDPAMSILT